MKNKQDIRTRFIQYLHASAYRHLSYAIMCLAICLICNYIKDIYDADGLVMVQYMNQAYSPHYEDSFMVNLMVLLACVFTLPMAIFGWTGLMGLVIRFKKAKGLLDGPAL